MFELTRTAGKCDVLTLCLVRFVRCVGGLVCVSGGRTVPGMGWVCPVPDAGCSCAGFGCGVAFDLGCVAEVVCGLPDECGC